MGSLQDLAGWYILVSPRKWPASHALRLKGGLVATQDQLQKSPCEKPTFRKKTFPEKITQNKESEMSDKVSSLAEVIKARRPDRFQDTDSASLDLYRAGNEISDSLVIDKSQSSSAVNIGGGIKMQLQDTIYSHFPKQPQLKSLSERYYEEGINVVVFPEPLPEALSKDK
ncbi:unnamed protein product [Rhizophagus irregularis]|nr:unnamed protein product [Rhizophagus irregularis]